MPLPNTWNLRNVAETAVKPCYVCFKPTAAVLITPDNEDFFYVCRGHLTDRGFCSPILDEAAEAAKRKKAELEAEIELVKKEYEEKLRKKGKSKAKKEEKNEKSKETEKEDSKKEDEASKKIEAERDDKIKALSKDPSPQLDLGPRVFALHKNIFQMRVDRIRNAEMAQRNRERIKNPMTFPSVPRGDI